MKCAQCGEELPKTFEYCPFCGAKVEQKESATISPTQFDSTQNTTPAQQNYYVPATPVKQKKHFKKGYVIAIVSVLIVVAAIPAINKLYNDNMLKNKPALNIVNTTSASNENTDATSESVTSAKVAIITTTSSTTTVPVVTNPPVTTEKPHAVVTDAPVTTKAVEKTTAKPVEPVNVASLGELNALDSALSYLRFTNFSYSGLIDQLEFEGFTASEAKYGVDHCGANWSEQALEDAKSYLEFTSFSKSGLKGQLEFEGYTSEQAKYGVENCGADWNEQAALKAQSYMDFSSFSRAQLIDQLEFEGFTSAQAEYGVSAVGY